MNTKLVEQIGDFKELSKAIVLHRTDSISTQSTLDAWDVSPFGTHFLIDTDGTIYQCASLNQYTQHIVDIRSKCYDNDTCDENEKKYINSLGWKPKTLSNYEKQKSYPNRYPLNTESIGIEVVGKPINGEYIIPNEKQKESTLKLVRILQTMYNITRSDIYAHGTTGVKNKTESLYLREYIMGELE